MNGKTMYVGYFVYEDEVYLVAASTDKNSVLAKLKEKGSHILC
jgi:hypothetical protein